MFNALVAEVDAAVEEHLTDQVRIEPRAGGAAILVAAIFDAPAVAVAGERLRGVFDEAAIRVPVSEVSRLVEGDILVVDGRRWKVMGAPTRPDDGRWWFAELKPVGPA